MAKTERLQVRLDAETKTKVTAQLKDSGITITDAVTLFLHELLASEGRPFVVDLTSRNK